MDASELTKSNERLFERLLLGGQVQIAYEECGSDFCLFVIDQSCESLWRPFCRPLNALYLVLPFTAIEYALAGTVIAVFFRVVFRYNGRSISLVGVGGFFTRRIMLLCNQAEAIFDSVNAKVQAVQVGGECFRVMVHESGGLVWLRPTRRPCGFEELGTLNEQVVVNSEALLVGLLTNEHIERLGQVVVVSADETVSLSRDI